MTNKLREDASLGKITGKRKWYVRLIAAGSGASGFHTEEALRSTGPAAWPVGTKCNVDHQSWSDYMEQPAGSLKTLAGIVTTTPEFRDDIEGEPAGLYAEIQFGEEWGPFVEQFAEFIGLSITSDYWGDEKTESGQPIVEGYIPSVLNTVDLVTAPGAKGRLLKALESYDGAIPVNRESSGILLNDTNTKENAMTPEDRATLIAEMIAAVKEALTPEAPVVDDETEGPDAFEVAEALVEANLPASARKRVAEAVQAGATIEAAIASEKQYIEDIRKESDVDAAPGRIRESHADDKPKPALSVNGWSN